MEKVLNKRKVGNYKTLEGRRIERKKVSTDNLKKEYKISPFVQVKLGKGKKQKKDITVTGFELVVVKIPWYRRIMREFMSYFA